MKKDFIIEEIKYIKSVNAIKYKVLKRYSYYETAVGYFNIHKHKPLLFTDAGSINTDYPLFVYNSLGKKELRKIKD